MKRIASHYPYHKLENHTGSRTLDSLIIACGTEHDLSAANLGSRWPGMTLTEGPGDEHFLLWHLHIETSSSNHKSFKTGVPQPEAWFQRIP